jgi:sporulation protein YlmC with PRC-barrel domain
VIRLSALRDARLVTEDGQRLGRVHEIRAEDGRVTALDCGPGGFIERLTAKTGGRRIPWEKVRKIDGKVVVVALDDAKARRS